MTISYNWLRDYLPGGTETPAEIPVPGKIAEILTAIGLEVESMHSTGVVKGGLNGLLVGEVITCEKHPGADKLKVTTVSTNNGKLLHIVCGANNVAIGQKVVVAPVGTVIYPKGGEALKIQKAKIRGIESEGIICAEDEIGIGTSHDGILILPADTPAGTPVSEILKIKQDHIFEIGLTPNRIDAMSHIGVAKDVCAYLSHHNKEAISAVLPYPKDLKQVKEQLNIDVKIENKTACKRYSGVSISNITVTDSPEWLQDKLISIGLKPISNIVDITNFILHETGQPLHAFDADKIKGNKIIVRSAHYGETFVTLDGKKRTLFADDLLICDESDGMCIAGVYGGATSGVTAETRNIFIESAWFHPTAIRKTSTAHDLRTDAAARFEKGTDISNTVNVLQRAASLVIEICGGEVSGSVIDIYPDPMQKTSVVLADSYLKKLSGKVYTRAAVKQILTSLGFEFVLENDEEIEMKVPFSKPDITIPADIVEEIMRIDGLDNIEIPATISIAPSVEKNKDATARKEASANMLTGSGFYEIFTNSITNSAFYDEPVLQHAVRMINSLSSELDIMRPDMLRGGLQVIAHNHNRKNYDLRLFEFGKTYATADHSYKESIHLALFCSGNTTTQSWKGKPAKTDLYYLKGVVESLLLRYGINSAEFLPGDKPGINHATEIRTGNDVIGYLGEVSASALKQFDIKQPVFYADLDWEKILEITKTQKIKYKEVTKFPAVVRDLSLVVDSKVTYAMIKQAGLGAKIASLHSIELFDIFESEKLGTGKKAMAVSFTFLDETKTLTDTEIDGFMQQITLSYSSTLNAEIRK
jgi:phenylalanyl-tRNA synthetase beta chain